MCSHLDVAFGHLGHYTNDPFDELLELVVPVSPLRGSQACRYFSVHLSIKGSSGMMCRSELPNIISVTCALQLVMFLNHDRRDLSHIFRSSPGSCRRDQVATRKSRLDGPNIRINPHKRSHTDHSAPSDCQEEMMHANIPTFV